MEKSALRKEILARLPLVRDRREKEEEVTTEVIAYLRDRFFGRKRLKIAAYLSKPEEFGTDELIRRLSDELDAIVFVPKVVGKDLIFEKYKENMLLFPSSYGVREPLMSGKPSPRRFDAIIVPLVAFDEQNRRLGRGKGYYDRFLAAHADAPAIGVAFAEQKADEVPTEKHDIPLDKVFYR